MKRTFLAATWTAICLSIGLPLSCAGNAKNNLYVEGTPAQSVWTDPVTGYLWQRESPGAAFSWADAQRYCATLTLGGRQGWKLPDIDELRTLISDCPTTQTGGACPTADSCLMRSCWNDATCISLACESGQGPGGGGCFWPAALGGDCGGYWSASAVADWYEYSWNVNFNGAIVSANQTAEALHVRCVQIPGGVRP